MTVLDWRRYDTGPAKPCIHCTLKAICRDHLGRPCHKVCAEKKLTDRAATAGRP